MTDNNHPTPPSIDTIEILYVVSPDGYSLPQPLCEAVKAQVEEVLPALRPGEKYTLEMLCGDEFWGALSPGDRRVAGRCMVHLVGTGQLPLEIAGRTSANATLYRLK